MSLGAKKYLQDMDQTMVTDFFEFCMIMRNGKKHLSMSLFEVRIFSIQTPNDRFFHDLRLY